MPFSVSTGSRVFGREMYGAAPLINFSDGSTGDDRTSFDFTSPNQYYMCEMQPGLDTNGTASGDIFSFILSLNQQSVFLVKFALGSANEPVQSQFPSIKFVLEPQTRLQAIFNMQSGTGMVGTATCMFRGVQFG